MDGYVLIVGIKTHAHAVMVVVVKLVVLVSSLYGPYDRLHAGYTGMRVRASRCQHRQVFRHDRARSGMDGDVGGDICVRSGEETWNEALRHFHPPARGLRLDYIRVGMIIFV
jgi:hypothetical protein